MKNQRPDWENPNKRVRRKSKRKLNRQNKKAAIRAKYGPSMKPGKVTVRQLVDPELRAALAQAKARSILGDGELWYVHRAPGGPWRIASM